MTGSTEFPALHARRRTRVMSRSTARLRHPPDGAHPGRQEELSMSPNKQLVQTYLDGFRTNDHAKILSCLTDDIEWTVFGWFHLTGKQAYDEAIDGPGYVGPPRLDVVRMVEEGDTVMAELLGWVPREGGGT